MIESHGVNTSPILQNYSHFIPDTPSFHEASEMVFQQENVILPTDQAALAYSFQAVTTSSRILNRTAGAGDASGMLRALVQNIFTEQGMKAVIATDDTMIDIASLSRQEAQELIAEDGCFGVEKTSERIFQFAIEAAGDDPARSDNVRLGVAAGLEEALKALGGWLPDISYSTYDGVMNKLDDWAGVSTSQIIDNQVSS